MANEVTLAQMMAAREWRAQQQRAHAREGRALVSLTLNIPGPVKRLPLTDRAFRDAKELITSRGGEILAACVDDCGHFALFGMKGNPAVAKRLMLDLEDVHPLGRLLDIDVLDGDCRKIGRPELGLPDRQCLICGGPAHECARSRTHPAIALRAAVAAILCSHFVRRDACQALLSELQTTPKPGLVDRESRGAHRDMDFSTFLRSIEALSPFFGAFVLHGAEAQSDRALWSALLETGRRADIAMMKATGGVNTHRGAVFLLGLIAGACGRLHARGEALTPETILDAATRIAQCALADPALQGRGGARQEAAGGFPWVRMALGWLQQYLWQGAGDNDAGVCTLLLLIARAPDTNMVSRSDGDAVRRVQRDVAARIEGKTVPELLSLAKALDGEFTERNLSPGGCADLLAAAWMIQRICTQEGMENHVD